MRGSPGFTIPELLVSILLFAFVSASLTSLQATFLRDHPRTLAQSAVQSDATRAGRALRAAAETASYLEIPGPGASNIEQMTLWRNLDARTNAPVLAGQAARYSHFCVSLSAQLYLYEGDAPMPVIDCGVSPDGLLLAGNPDRDLSISARFNRPVGENNLLQIFTTSRIEANAAHPAYEVSETVQIVLRTGRGP